MPRPALEGRGRWRGGISGEGGRRSWRAAPPAPVTGAVALQLGGRLIPSALGYGEGSRRALWRGRLGDGPTGACSHGGVPGPPPPGAPWAL